MLSRIKYRFQRWLRKLIGMHYVERDLRGSIQKSQAECLEIFRNMQHHILNNFEKYGVQKEVIEPSLVPIDLNQERLKALEFYLKDEIIKAMRGAMDVCKMVEKDLELNILEIEKRVLRTERRIRVIAKKVYLGRRSFKNG